MNSFNPLWHRIIVLLISVACGSGIFLAQQSTGQPTAPPLATASDSKAGGYDLEIVDGQVLRAGHKVEATLGNILDALRHQYPEANIISSPGLEKIKVADLKLRTGRLADELEALRVASGERFEFHGPSGPNPPIDPNTGQPLGGVMTLNSGLFVLRPPGPIPEKRRDVAAFNISPYLDWLRRQSKDAGKDQDEIVNRCLDEIQKILKTTIKDLNQGSEDFDHPSCQYHPGATLLVIVGTTDSIAVAHKIVNALPGMSSVASDPRGPYHLGEPGQPTPEPSAAEAAFRKRYGLPPRSSQPPNSSSEQPGSKP
ncbi:MAG TPA: hypothetical protein VL793_05630 [Patescibacteria group bacterium]|nr:hypothetical protein [Patescibacteria group bacterium]